MANHKSALKRIRQSETRRLRAMNGKEQITAAFNKVSSMLERLASKGVISKNKAANLKSKLAKHVNKVMVG